MLLEFLGAAHEVTGVVIFCNVRISGYWWIVVWSRDRIYM